MPWESGPISRPPKINDVGFRAPFGVGSGSGAVACDPTSKSVRSRLSLWQDAPGQYSHHPPSWLSQPLCNPESATRYGYAVRRVAPAP